VPFVELDSVRLNYRAADGHFTLALDGASLRIEKGQFAALVGPSGCGKSTVLKLVSGLLAPSAGSVAVAGRPVSGPLRSAGMAFQRYFERPAVINPARGQAAQKFYQESLN